MAAEAAVCELSQHQLLHWGDLRLEPCFSRIPANADQSTAVLCNLTLRELKDQAGLPSLGLVLIHGRRGQGQCSAETEPCRCTKGTIDCRALLVTLALGRGRNGGDKTL